MAITPWVSADFIWSVIEARNLISWGLEVLSCPLLFPVSAETGLFLVDDLGVEKILDLIIIVQVLLSQSKVLERRLSVYEATIDSKPFHCNLLALTSGRLLERADSWPLLHQVLPHLFKSAPFPSALSEALQFWIEDLIRINLSCSIWWRLPQSFLRIIKWLAWGCLSNFLFNCQPIIKYSFLWV